ncbi:MAG: glutathione S-transferase family protein [Betaproteobacteria bacterium]|jgi:GST-like protein|nr:glutathione S-transferase family protein [Betaproteobacteria bacterium]
MITLYTWPTPNGKKVQIMLEETGLKYKALPINISANAQFAPDFLRISPNNKIPAIVDSKGPKGKPYSLFESGAILIYLAGKTNTLLGTTETDRYDILQWLMFQMGGLGPMLGQAHHFRIYAPQKIDYAIQRYTQEAQRLYGVMDQRLAQCKYLGCDEYSIADIAAWPWIASYERQGVDIAAYPNVRRWFESIGSRPAVIRGCAVLADLRK